MIKNTNLLHQYGVNTQCQFKMCVNSRLKFHWRVDTTQLSAQTFLGGNIHDFANLVDLDEG